MSTEFQNVAQILASLQVALGQSKTREARLRAELDELKDRVEVLEARRGPGRPRKVQHEGIVA